MKNPLTNQRVHGCVVVMGRIELPTYGHLRIRCPSRGSKRLSGWVVEIVTHLCVTPC